MLRSPNANLASMPMYAHPPWLPHILGLMPRVVLVGETYRRSQRSYDKQEESTGEGRVQCSECIRSCAMET